MNFKEIKELIEIFSSKGSIDDLEVERSGVRVRMRRSDGRGAPVEAQSVPAVVVEADPIAAAPPGPAAGADEPGLIYVTSPIVGTFYRAPSPDADPFVGVGDRVEPGMVLCIVEAMKLMNEIEAEHGGEIASVFVENGHPVEYGERLFAIRPR